MNPAKIGRLVFLFSVFGVLATWGFLPSLAASEFTFPVLWSLALLGLIVWVVFSLDYLTVWAKRRSTQFGISLAITAAAVFAMLGAVNWMGVKFNRKWDVTDQKVYSLSEQSKKIARELKEEITLRIWTTNIDRMSGGISVANLLENYRIAGNGKIKIEIKNPNDDPMSAKQDQVKRDHLIIVKALGSGRESRVEAFSDSKSEEQITNAIVQTQKNQKKMICFVSGHGEFSTSKTGPDGLSNLKDSLEQSSYQTKEVNLALMESFPKECEALVLAGPQSAPVEKEVNFLTEFLVGGGKLLALMGPGTPDAWNKLLAPYGVEVQKDIVFDKRTQPRYAVLTKNFSRDIEITKDFGLNLMLPESSSIKVPTSDNFAGAKVRSFVSSEEWTYAKTGGPKEIKEMNPKPTDRKGPLPLAVLITKPTEKKAAAVVPGSTPTVKPDGPKAPTPAGKPAEPKASTGWLRKLQQMSPTFVSAAQAQAGHEGHNHGPGDHGDEPSTDQTIEQGHDYDSMKNMLSSAASTTTDGAKEVNPETAVVLVSNSIFAANAYIGYAGNLDFVLNSLSFLMRDQDLIGIRPREVKKGILQLDQNSERQVAATILIITLLFGVGFFTAMGRKFSS